MGTQNSAGRPRAGQGSLTPIGRLAHVIEVAEHFHAGGGFNVDAAFEAAGFSAATASRTRGVLEHMGLDDRVSLRKFALAKEGERREFVARYLSERFPAAMTLIDAGQDLASVRGSLPNGSRSEQEQSRAFNFFRSAAEFARVMPEAPRTRRRRIAAMDDTEDTLALLRQGLKQLVDAGIGSDPERAARFVELASLVRDIERMDP